jgi:regulatory protein
MSRKSRGSRSEARNFALKLLGYRSRSRKELSERLGRKGFSSSQINNTIKFLEQAGLINDETVARELCRYAVEKKHFGKKGIEQFLYSRGIGKDLINEQMSTLQPDIDHETAARLVKRRLQSLDHFPRHVIRRRLCGMLQRRGFSGDVIRSTMKAIKQDQA